MNFMCWLTVGLIAATCSSWPASGQSPRPRPSVPATGPAAPPASNAAIPAASIAVDGQTDDWSAVPVRLRCKPSVTSSYKPVSVRVAADDQFLYVLIELTLGVRERFDKQLPSGRVSSGALGYLRLNVDATGYRVWLPTGFAMHTLKGKTTMSLQMSYELGRQSSGNRFDRVLTKEYPADKDFIAIEGKYVELKIPLENLAAKPTSAWNVAFDPM
jgi:hypothetical protein